MAMAQAGFCDQLVTMSKLEGNIQPQPKEELNPEKPSLALEPEYILYEGYFDCSKEWYK